MPDQSAVIAATVSKFRELLGEFDASQERVQGLNQAIAVEQGVQEQLHAQAQKCYAAAELFGFDLLAALAADADRRQEQPDISALRPSLSPWASPRPSVREFILDRAQAAYPNPVRAKALKAEFERSFGGEIHEKTMGMTLYRIAQRDGSLRRYGWDWFYVPPELRIVESETQELPYGGS